MKALALLLVVSCSAVGLVPDNVGIEHSMHRGGDTYSRLDASTVYLGENDSYTITVYAEYGLGDRMRHEAERQWVERAEAVAERDARDLEAAIERLNTELSQALATLTAVTYEVNDAEPAPITIHTGDVVPDDDTTVFEDYFKEIIGMAVAAVLGVILIVSNKRKKNAKVHDGGDS